MGIVCLLRISKQVFFVSWCSDAPASEGHDRGTVFRRSGLLPYCCDVHWPTVLARPVTSTSHACQILSSAGQGPVPRAGPSGLLARHLGGFSLRSSLCAASMLGEAHITVIRQSLTRSCRGHLSSSAAHWFTKLVGGEGRC